MNRAVYRNRNGFRKSKSKFHENHDSSYKHKFNESFSTSFQNKEEDIVPESKKQLTSKKTVEIDSGIFLSLIKSLLKQNLLTKEELNTLLKTAEDHPNEIIIQDPKNQDRVFHINKHTTKSEMRDYWLYLMKKGELYCDICGNPIVTTTGRFGLTYDHIWPRSKGGRTDGINGSPTHSKCNSLKTNYVPKTWEQIGYSVLKENNILLNLQRCRYQYTR